MKPSKNCIECNQVFIKNRKFSKAQWKKAKLCSVACRGKHLGKIDSRNVKISEAFNGEGNPNWKGGLPKCKKCKKQLVNYATIYCRKCHSPSNWKGEKASYVAHHQWVRRYLGKPQKCEHCKTTANRMYHWANVSGEYFRELSDWVRLCVPCHSKHDRMR